MIYILFFILIIIIKCVDELGSKKNLISIDNSKLEIKVGETQYELINDEQIFIIDSPEQKTLLMNFFSINCDIKIETYIKEENDINKYYQTYKLNNIRNNDTFSIFLEANEISKTEIKVFHLKNDYNQNNQCPIIIDSFYEKDSSLEIESNLPIILFFDNHLKEINLSYNSRNDNYITCSFLLNDMAKLKIEYPDIKEDQTKKIKIISNTNSIFLSNLPQNNNKIINIKITREDNIENPILLGLKVFTDKLNPIILQNNYLNPGFITSTSQYRYYYMNISKDDEGEIMLHDKRQYGKLFGRICNMDECSFNNNYDYPNNEKNYLEFNHHYKKLSFKYNETQKCKDGCFLLITYEHDISSTKKEDIIGYEFTLLLRIWNYEEWNTLPIINIPYNEYIFGFFDKNSINHHYYSIFVPNETEKIILEIKSNYIDGFYGNGKKKLNTYNSNIDKVKKIELEGETVLSIERKENNFNNNYFSFAFRSKNFFDKKLSFYYFRILQLRKADKLIIPLDSNILNIFNSSINQNNNNNFFIIKNDYNQLFLKYSIFFFDAESIYIGFYKCTEEIIDISQDYLNQIIYKYENFTNVLEDNTIIDIENKNNNVSYILYFVEFNTNSKNILSTIYNNEKNIFPQIYSPQIYQLENKTNINFSLNDNFLLMLMWVFGEGEIQNLENSTLALDDNFKRKSYSFSLDDIDFIHSINQNNFIFYLGLNYISEKSVLIEKEIEKPLSEVYKRKYFPIYYIFKYKLLQNYTINIDFNFKILDFVDYKANFTIEEMLCNSSVIKRIRNEELELFKGDKFGYYDVFTKNGFLELNYNETELKLVNNLEETTYYILIKISATDIDSYGSNVFISLCSLNKYNNKIISYLPINQFIYGSFDLPENNKNDLEISYYIDNNNNVINKNIIIEFTKNYGGIELKDRSPTSYKYGYENYIINTSEYTTNFFTIKLKDDYNKKIEGLEKCFFMFRYFYDNYNEYEYKFNEKYQIQQIAETNSNSYNVSFEFENIKSLNNINHKIGCNLFLDEKREELLNTTSIILSKPINKHLEKADIIEENNTFVFHIEIPKNLNNYKFIMQIKFDVDNDNYYQKSIFLVYTIPINLTEELGIKNNEEKEKSNSNIKLYIVIFLSIFVIIIIVIIFLVLYLIFKKKNKKLKEKVLAISFANGIDISNNVNESKKDEEYETTFI